MKLIRMLKHLRDKRVVLLTIALLLGVGVLLPTMVHAQALESIKAGVLWAIANLIGAIIKLLGGFTLVLINLLIRVASYNGYLTSPAVITGWVIVRDVANMFFVALLLIISIGTIVNPDKFGGIKAVFKVLIFAVFVNFSKTIAGIFIDVSQVVMITFVNGFAQAAGGNFADALGLTKLMEINPGSLTDKAQTQGISLLGGLGSIILAALMFVIMNVIIGVMVVALIVRMVTLWFLVVVSPLAFALGASDVTKPRYAEWWKRFSAELTAGPTVAFFLWLSLVTVQEYKGADIGGTIDGKSALGASSNVECAASEFCTEDNIMRFVIAASMMLAGLMFAKEFSGVGGELAGAAWSKGKGYAGKFALWSAKRAAVPAVAAAVGGIPLAAGAMALGTQKGRLLAGKYLAGGPVGKWVPGVRGIGLKLQASARREQEEEEKKASETMRFATADQRKNVAFSKTATRASRKLAMVNIASDKVAMQKLSDDPLERARMLKHLHEGLTDEAQYGDEKAIAGMGKVELYDPRVIDDLGKREGAIKKMVTNEFISMDTAALTPDVVEMMSEEQRQKLYKSGKQEHRNALNAFYSDRASRDPAAVKQEIDTSIRSIEDLVEAELRVPDVAVEVINKPPSKEKTQIMNDPGKRTAIREGTERELGARRVYDPTGRGYDQRTQMLAEGNAMAARDISIAFNVDTNAAPANLNAGNFTGPRSAEDKLAFEKAIRGRNGAEVAFATNADLINNGNDVGQLLGSVVDVKQLLTLNKKADGDAEKERVIRAIVKTIEVRAGTGDAKARANLAQIKNDWSLAPYLI